MRVALNYTLYQIGWLACVLGAARGHEVAGPSIGVALIGVHVVLAGRPQVELRLLAIAAGLGATADSLLCAAGLLRFDSNPAGWPAWLAPPWIAVMWAQFATTLRFALARFQRLGTVRLALLGAVGGPVAYLSGRALGAVSFGASTGMALAGLAVAWAALLPLVIEAARRSRPPLGRYRWESGDPASASAGNQGTNAFVRRT